MKKLGLAVFLSLLFHLSQLTLISVWPIDQLSQNETTTTPVEFEVIEEKKMERQQEKPIVKTIKDPQQSSKEEPVKFFAEEDNRTKAQTRAPKFGQFRNGGNSRAPRRENRTQNETKLVHPTFDSDGSQFREQLNMPAQSEYQLPDDIQFGNATNLNTDAHIYASFYNRVVDLFYIRWSQKLDSIWQRLSTETKLNLAGKVWSSEVEIWLDSSGKYYQGLIMKKSGFSPFDQAAIFAFRDADFFPNPPRAKVEPDGFIRLKYRISIHVR